MLFLSPFDAYNAFIPETYDNVEDMCEPDGSLSLKEIVNYTFAGVNAGMNVYNDYDDSEEGASFPLDYDRFDGLQDMLDMNSRINSKIEDVLVDSPPPTNEESSPIAVS